MPKMGTPQFPGFYTEDEQCARFGVAKTTLRRWRREGRPPASVRIGRQVLYPHGGDEKMLAEQLELAEAEHKKGPNGLAPRRGRRPRKNSAR